MIESGVAVRMKRLIPMSGLRHCVTPHIKSGGWAPPIESLIDMDNTTVKKVNTMVEESAGHAEASSDGSLTPEHIGHLLKVLGDDIINDMLANAGLDYEDSAEDTDKASDAEASKDLNDPEAAALDAALNSEEPAPALHSDAQNQTKRKRPRRRVTAKRRFLFLVIFLLVILMVYAVNTIYNSVSINSDDPIQYSAATDEISADEGILNVNNVSVRVPSDGTEKYSISYSWSEDDEKYPSVPHAITAVYSESTDKTENTEAGNGTDSSADSGSDEAVDADSDTGSAGNTAMLYSISLYRNETFTAEEVKKSGKKADSWFDDWGTVSEGDILQTPLKAGGINGFYIFPQPSSDGGADSDYNDYSYYFAVKDGKGISIYVIEGVCIDNERSAEFKTIMDNCIHSISIK